jgi:salicylate hydroxylase
MAPRELHVGIVGAGMGGLAAAIAIARAGAKVTLLEAAPELGEIGAGIQVSFERVSLFLQYILMSNTGPQIFPNVSRFLIRWGVDKIIGDNLVEFDSCNTYEGPDANLIARSTPKAMNESAGFPW